jgi:hypothetical protein
MASVPYYEAIKFLHHIRVIFIQPVLRIQLRLRWIDVDTITDVREHILAVLLVRYFAARCSVVNQQDVIPHVRPFVGQLNLKSVIIQVFVGERLAAVTVVSNGKYKDALINSLAALIHNIFPIHLGELADNCVIQRVDFLAALGAGAQATENAEDEQG